MGKQTVEKHKHDWKLKSFHKYMEPNLIIEAECDCGVTLTKEEVEKVLNTFYK